MKNTKLYLTEWQSTQIYNHVRDTQSYENTKGYTGLLNRILKSIDKGFITKFQLHDYMVRFFPLIQEGRNNSEKVLIELEKQYIR